MGKNIAFSLRAMCGYDVGYCLEGLCIGNEGFILCMYVCFLSAVPMKKSNMCHLPVTLTIYMTYKDNSATISALPVVVWRDSGSFEATIRRFNRRL